MVKSADRLFTWSWYAPGCTCGRLVPSMSPGVTASRETGNETCTTVDWPGSRVTRAKVTSRCGGTTTALTGWCTYTGTMSVPARLPVFVTVKLAVAVPFGRTRPGPDRPLVWNVVYDSPKPNGNSGL